MTERALSRLPERERMVVRRFYGLGDENPITLREVGGILGLSAERVRQIRKKAIKMIRAEPASAPLRDRYECLMENRSG
jgi:RNA polymerase primary sigma factor